MEEPIKKEICPSVTEAIRTAILQERDNGFIIDKLSVQIKCKRDDYRLEKTINLEF